MCLLIFRPVRNEHLSSGDASDATDKMYHSIRFCCDDVKSFKGASGLMIAIKSTGYSVPDGPKSTNIKFVYVRGHFDHFRHDAF